MEPLEADQTISQPGEAVRAIACVALVLGCGNPPRPAPQPGPDLGAQHIVHEVEHRPTPDRALVRFHMRQQLTDLDDLVAAVLAGRLDEARTFAFAISREARRRAPADASEHVAALAIADAATVDAAARLVPRLVASCASCHTGWLPARAATTIPGGEPTVATHAARLRWATAQARDALMSATDGPWRTALDVFVEAPLPSLDRTFGRRLQKQASDRFGKLGFDTLDERVRAYGEILVTCTRCHAATMPSFGRSR